MRRQIKTAFAWFWPGFTPDHFRAFFPAVHEKYDFVPSATPEVVFYSVFSPQFRPYADPTSVHPVTRIRPGPYVRVFVTGENFEPDMSNCEFAISFSAITDSPNHLRLPLWVYENRGWGFGPEMLIKAPGTDWEMRAAERGKFCNFVYLHEVPFRDAVFRRLSEYRQIDSAGRHLNNMAGWTVPMSPNRVSGKVKFFRKYKFTLAVENTIWPGYTTEKLVDPMYAGSIPIYFGDPLARLDFNPESYIDFANFRTMGELLEFVREVDNNRDLYLTMLAAPYFHANRLPAYARDETIIAFFDRIAATRPSATTSHGL